MGQYDLATEAALSQLKSDELAKTPGGEFVDLVNDLLSLVGVKGPTGIASGASNLLLKVRRLAGASYADNLIFAISAVRDDLKSLYKKHAELRERIESLENEPKFIEAISALALRAMHTSVKDRLKRLARIVVNGVKENDLEPESLDDMMRAAVELTEKDLLELGVFCFRQTKILAVAESSPMQWHENVRNDWQQRTIANSVAFRERRLSYLDHIGSCPRLAAFGFIVAISPRGTSNSPEDTPYALLPQGKQYYERLQDIAAE